MFSILSKQTKGIARFFAIIIYLEAVAVPYSAIASYQIGITTRYRNIHLGPEARKLAGFEKNGLGTLNRSNVESPNYETNSPLKTINKLDKDFGTGPTQPEMQSFQSVNTNNMVDLFTGDFSYNIPLLDVGGYPVNIHYQSGITMDQEASWVGLGWNINPGTITRNMRGLPDDFKGDSDGVSKTVSMKPNITSGVALGGSGEILGFPFFGLDADASISLFHNNYKGWGIETSVKPSINAAIGSKGALTGSLSLSNNSQNGLDISPSMGILLGKKDAETKGTIVVGSNMNSRTGIHALQLTAQVRQHFNDYKKSETILGTGISSYISFAQPSYTPSISIPFTSRQYAYKFKQGLAGSFFFTSGFVKGYQSRQEIEESDKTIVLPSYGYIYYEKASNSNSALLDFNREKDIPFREKTPHIAIPIYTYDTYSISGEGTGGMFRPYRGDVGFVYDHVMSTKSKSSDFTFEHGLGSIFHGGAEVSLVNAVTKNNPWLIDNYFKDAIGFKERDTSYENVYFKNPGEKGIVDSTYLDLIGNDNLIRADLSPLNAQNMSSIAASRNIALFKNGRILQHKPLSSEGIYRRQRDKRTQVITYLTAAEASILGLQKRIRSYAVNSFPVSTCNTNYTEYSRVDINRKTHHISEIDVLNPDGRRYVYGIPVYNLSQEDVTMSTKAGNGSNITGLTSYVAGIDNTTNNNLGKDGYYSREKLPPYAHSFLLTGILSPDYIDITGDGISEDDMGDAIKFNYSQVYNSANPFRWRAPFEANQASYNEGLRTDNRDEKGSYSYGAREQWYLNSIESKTMIATFVIDSIGRSDSYGVIGENGGINSAQRLYRLKQINLYTKADYLKNGPTNAKPVKTVNFEYTHELCSNVPSSFGGMGKLTLKKIWFSYNKNDKGKQNPYVFDYNSDTTNPSYNHKSYDRWGNYKDPSGNPGPTSAALTNLDYPYSLQIGELSASNTSWDSAQAAKSASSWTLSQIELPSGGRIKVSYESDDYAYVQNRRAMQFFSIIGFGNSSSAAVGNFNLYSPNGDNNYVFIKVTDPATTKEEIFRKYLDGVPKLYFKVAVKMPNDKWGQGYEVVPCYADIVSYGIMGNPAERKIWIQLKPLKGNENPLLTSAIQFLRLNLPSKAYPYSEPGNQLSIKSLMGMLASVSPNLIQTVKGYDTYAKTKGLCRTVLAGQSFVRLNNPIYKKLGGGLRVKQVTIEDNWDYMTGSQMTKNTYGQKYDYTTSTLINWKNPSC